MLTGYWLLPIIPLFSPFRKGGVNYLLPLVYDPERSLAEP